MPSTTVVGLVPTRPVRCAYPWQRKAIIVSKFEIVDAMSRDIFVGLTAKLDGKPLKLRGSKVFSGSRLRLPFTRRPKLTYPQLVTADVRLSGSEGGSLLELDVPQTISPASRGSKDDRHLGVRLRKVTLVHK